MPSREELEAALQSQGSSYAVGDDYPDTFGSKPLPAEWQSERTAYENAQAAAPPPATMSAPEEPEPPEPTSVAPETVSSESNMSPPPPVSAPSSPAPKPKAGKTTAPKNPPSSAAEPSRSEAPLRPEDQRLLDAYDPNTGSFNVSNNGIEDKALNPGAGTQQLRGESRMAEQRQLGLLGEAAESATGKAKAEAEVGAGRVEAGAQGVGNLRDSEQRRDERYEKMRDLQLSRMDDLKKEMGNPPKDTVGLVLGIIGAVAALGGKPEAGQALQVLNGAMNQRMKKWQAGIQAGQAEQDNLSKLVNQDRLAAMDDQRAEALLNDATYAEFDNAYDVLKRNAKNEGEVREIENAQNITRKAFNEAEQNRRAKAAAVRYRSKVNSALAGAKTEEEARAIANANGDVGRSIKGDMNKRDLESAKIGSEVLGQQKTGAEIGALQAKAQKDVEAAKGNNAWAPQGWTAPGGAQMPSGAVTQVADITGKKAQVAYSYDRLIQIAEGVQSGKISKIDPTAAKEIEDLRAIMTPMQTNYVGAGAPSGHEYDTFFKVASDPQEMLTRKDVLQSLVNNRRNLEGSYGRYLSSLGYSRGQAKGGGAPSSQRVRMSDGEVQELPTNVVEALRAQGHDVEDVQ